MRKGTIKLEDITLYDLLTVDTHGGKISIQDDAIDNSYNLIRSRSVFFSPDGLFAEVERNGLVLFRNKKPMDLEKLLTEWNRSRQSCVALIEGYAGCGKSTLVQYILQKQLQTFRYNYSFYNYDLEAQNDIIIRDDNGKVIKKSSIYEAIKKSFFEEFVDKIKINKNVFNDFTSLLESCREYQPFNNLFFDYYNTDTYNEISCNIKEDIQKNENVILKNLKKQTNKITSSSCLLALDYLFRLAMYKNRMVDKLYVCYDNLDAIEDADDLRNFDDDLVKFSWDIDDFIDILQRKGFFIGCATPHFVIMATYRKITAAMANIQDAAYKEVAADRLAGSGDNNGIYHIDATSIFSYRKIVDKREKYFRKYFEAIPNLSSELKRKIMGELASWNRLNQNLKIMDDRYACLWNRNYRTCSRIAHELYKETIYHFTQYVKFIEKSNVNDGYTVSKDEEGNNILCSYYGSSAIILSSVCKVFNLHHIWDQFLHLTQLIPDEPSYKKVSLSRIVLTYIYNNGPTTLKDMYDVFCRNGLFSYDKLCTILANMLARNKEGVWRRPIYYSKECIRSEKVKDIERQLLLECRRMKEGKEAEHNYEFIICDSGRAYVEQLMQEFEFFSNRLSNKNKPLYFYEKMGDINSIINSVYLAVLKCCENMNEFRNEYIKVNKIEPDDYLLLPIHPTTNLTHSPQLHTERIIFSHIAYLDNVRLYFLNLNVTPDMQKRRECNEMFISGISKYLKLYYTYIHPISTRRDFVAEKLGKIIKCIEDAINQGSNDTNILFQSVSIRSRK